MGKANKVTKKTERKTDKKPAKKVTKEDLARIDEEARLEYKIKSVKTQRLVFVPEPKQKWHYELIAMIPPIGHEFDCPREFDWFPYAKYEWLRIMDLDREHKLITPTKREGFYGYCLMVERLRRCMLEWDGKDISKVTPEKIMRSYLSEEIERLSEAINKAAQNLGLLKEEKNGSGKEEDGEEGDGEEKKNKSDGMFD